MMALYKDTSRHEINGNIIEVCRLTGHSMYEDSTVRIAIEPDSVDSHVMVFTERGFEILCDILERYKY